MLSKLKKLFNINYQKILSYLVLIFCFLFFPLFLIFNSLNIFFETNINNLRQNKFTEMSNTLEYLDKYSNNKRYFHFLFSKISEYSQKAEDPASYLEANIHNLKEKYPDKIEFVVWDNAGKIINNLTDRNGYSYVLNKLYPCLKEVSESVKVDSSINLSNLEVVKKNLNIFRNFLGKIFIPKNLKFPLINSVDAGPFIAGLGKGKSSVWYSVGEKISFLCFLSDELLNDFSGLEKVSINLNSSNRSIITGFSITPNIDKAVTRFPERFEADLTRALTTFDNAGDRFFENENSLIVMSMPQPEIRTFCYFRKNIEDWDIQYKRNLWFGIFTSILLAFYCLFGYYYLFKHHFFSIRWKLTILFLFANIAPILIVSFIAKGFLENKRISLKNEIISDLEKSMRDFDARYTSLPEDYSNRLNSVIDQIASKIGSDTIKDEERQRLESLYKEFNCSGLYIVASSSKFISLKRDESGFNQSREFLSSMSEAILAFANNKIFDKKQNDIFSNLFSPEDSEFIRLYQKSIRNVSELSMGELSWIYYGYLFGDKSIYNNNYLLIIMWNRDRFKNIFVKESFKTLYRSIPEGLFYIQSNSSNISYGSEYSDKNIVSILDKKSRLTEKISGNIEIDKKSHIFVCLNGTNLKDWTFLAISPEESVNREINLLIVQIVAGALVSLLLTIIIGHLLSLQFLKPIHNLGEAALAIGERNFSYRVPIGDKDEFGHLNQVFNRVIEGLGDFEVGRIVQESLFPGNHFDVGDYKIFGRSVVMTTLGGDYYDCFKINDEYQGIIIGDVAGHGIPAGLMMAMAKSAVLTSSEEIKLNPTLLTTRLNKMFFAIKNERLKRMMTFQYFVLRVNDGHLIYTNAGHCFPVIVDDNTKTATYLEYIATPLGISSRCRCKNQEFDLVKGQSLVLYTDGIVEAYNANGEQYGYERFKKRLPEFYDINPETFYYNLYNKLYKQWSPKPDDDLTLILVNRK